MEASPLVLPTTQLLTCLPAWAGCPVGPYHAVDSPHSSLCLSLRSLDDLTAKRWTEKNVMDWTTPGPARTRHPQSTVPGLGVDQAQQGSRNKYRRLLRAQPAPNSGHSVCERILILVQCYQKKMLRMVNNQKFILRTPD